ncbi:hypothetical protein LTS10_013225 [Elasticomyces elasticus]|nr:hypothetical protein LTS10_013225 [Elasticomyces elasticus]
MTWASKRQPSKRGGLLFQCIPPPNLNPLTTNLLRRKLPLRTLETIPIPSRLAHTIPTNEVGVLQRIVRRKTFQRIILQKSFQQIHTRQTYVEFAWRTLEEAERERQNKKNEVGWLRSLSNFAVALEKQGNYEAAEEMGWRARAGYDKVLGKEYPDTLTNGSNLASLLRYQGKYEAAEEMNRPALAGRDTVPGKEHPD